MRSLIYQALVTVLLVVPCTASNHSESGMQREKIALVVIDVQRCFTAGGTLPVAEGEEVIDVINGLRSDYSNYFDLVVHSQDWHCKDHVSFASQYNNYSTFKVINLSYSPNGSLCLTPDVHSPYATNCTKVKFTVPQTLWPDHCVIDTEDAEFHPRLKVETSDVIVRKGYHCQVDSYSAFYDNGGFGETELQKTLADAGITTVFITGLAQDFCVYFTAKDAKAIGFKTYVVLDATRPVDKARGEAAIADMVYNDIMVIRSNEVGKKLEEVNRSASVFKTSYFLVGFTIPLLVFY